MKNEDYLKEMAQAKSWTQQTIHSKKATIKQYTQYHNMTLEQLLDEAYIDEDNHTPYHRLKIRNRIQTFINHLQNTGKSYNTIKNRYNTIISFYKFYSIKTPDINLPSGKQFTNNPSQQLGYEDIITKQEIRKACDIADLHIKSILLVGASSGTAVKEIDSLTIRHFTQGTQEYHHQQPEDYNTEHEYIQEVLNTLQNHQGLIITQLNIIRSKVAKPYTTFINDEASRSIIQYLQHKIYNNYTLHLDDQLLKCNSNTRLKLEKLNKQLGYGKAGRYSKLSMHMIRRYFATTMSNPSNDELDDIMPDEYIDLFEGRSKSNMNKVYIKKDPFQLKKIYMKYMHKVQIYTDEEEKQELQGKIDTLEEEVENYKVLDQKVENIENLLNREWSKARTEDITDYF